MTGFTEGDLLTLLPLWCLCLLFQESKRSAQELSGRSDGNVKVIFPKQEVPALDTGSCAEPIKLGDYVLVKVECSLSLSLSFISTTSGLLNGPRGCKELHIHCKSSSEAANKIL